MGSFEKKFLTIDNVQDELSCSRVYVLELVNNQELKSKQIGEHTRILESSLEKYIEKYALSSWNSDLSLSFAGVYV